MQYKVPQNVDIEDKVIAGLTLRQFMFLMVSGGLVLLLYYFFTNELKFLFLPSAVGIGALGISLAFVKINDRPFEEFLLSAGKSLTRPSRRMWEKEVVTKEEVIKEEKKAEVTPRKKPVGEIRSNLQQLAMLVDSGGTHEWDNEENRLTNVKAAAGTDPQNVQDILEQTEKPSEKLSKFFEKAVKEVSATKKEPTVSAVATKQTTPNDFEYEAIQLENEKNLEDILEKTREDQENKEEALKEAKIKKFDRNN